MEKLVSELMAIKELVREFESKLELTPGEEIVEIKPEADFLQRLEQIESKLEIIEMNVENIVLFIKQFSDMFTPFANKIKSFKQFD